jgi:hypothetical protein
MAQQGTGLMGHSKLDTSMAMAMAEVVSGEERVIKIVGVVSLRIDPSRNIPYQIARLGYL